MASAARGQFDSDESDEEELYARGDKKVPPKNKGKNSNPYGDAPTHQRDATKEWSNASNDGRESNTSTRTPVADESSTNTFRHDMEQKPASSAAVPKSKSGKKKRGHKNEEKPKTDDVTHMVDTFSDTTETQPFDSFDKEQPAVASTSMLKSMFRRESFKNMGKALSSKMHSSNLDPQDENEEFNQDQQNKNQSHANPMSWMKDRFRKPNKDAINEQYQPRAILHDIEMDEMNLDSSDEGRTDGNNLLSANNPAAMTHSAERQSRPTSQNNNSYGQNPSAAVDVDDVAQMNEKERKVYGHKMCMSVALAVILVGGVILGVVLWSLSSLGLAFQILGPTIFGLSLFALVYKMFLTFIWKEDPYQFLIGQFKRINSAKSPR